MKNQTIFFLLFVALPGCPADEDENDTGNVSDGESTGGDESSSSGEAELLEIIGEYDDNFEGHHEITMTAWIYDAGEFGVTTTNIMQYDNEAGWVAGEDAGMPGTFLRFDWTYDDAETLWYCNTVFDATTLEEAIAAAPADATDPAAGGCGGMFPWTMLTPA